MAKKIEKLIYTNERGESITFSHASIFHTNEVSGLSDVRNEIYSINSMGQDGDTYLGNRIQSREIEIVGSIRERDKDRMRDYRRHTFTITNSTERYPKKYRFTLVNRIQEKAVDIYEMTLEANELDLRQADEHRQRQRLQAKALTYCKELLFFIELSQEMSFISMKSCEYWSKLALEVKYMIAAWKKRDKARV